jgi:hypothetical protein
MPLLLCGFQIGAKRATDDKTPSCFLTLLGITKRNVMVCALSYLWYDRPEDAKFVDKNDKEIQEHT